ncbi:type 1 fimbrial protein [Pseudomonas sp. NFXW11]|uniref:fimbrial protein n=1 Tax=Pseudomonas sp. NFXW11 TaxID=2819531 RepID=UPI003CFADFE8
MKLKSIASIAASTLMLAALTPVVAQAQNNTGNVEFQGQITSVSCRVQVDANGLDRAVQLGDVSPLVFADGIGSASEFKEFDLYLSGDGCTDGSKAMVTFNNSGHIDPGTGNLRLIGPGSATGVQIQILNNAEGNMEKIDLTKNDNQQVAEVSGNKALLKFKASYVATSTDITEGLGNSNIDFMVSY